MKIQMIIASIALITTLAGGTLKVDNYFAHENDFQAFKLEYRLERMKSELRKIKKEIRGYKRKERKGALSDSDQEEFEILLEEQLEIEKEMSNLVELKG